LRHLVAADDIPSQADRPNRFMLSSSMNRDHLLAALSRMRVLLPTDRPIVVPLTGGVSSDIVRVDFEDRSICIKCALPQLRVDAEWYAPVDRNHYEAEWLRVAGRIVPDAVPRILGDDREAGMFAMPFLDPMHHPVWKEELRAGRISPGTAREVGIVVATIHRHTADDPDIASRFATDHVFFPIRLDPYLAAAAKKHPECAPALENLVRVTSTTKRALVHGDVSPKNILVGPRGPVLLDAECAWYGDPAFDLAFCLNHLLLKCVWQPQWTDRYLQCFDALAGSYLAGVTWEPSGQLEARAAHLLPALLLARVDGKSPVEYITRDQDRDRIRVLARALLLEPPGALSEVRNAWKVTWRTTP
jgi:tRNA A-37 threonylcarbamoyl transferase component Bud32